MWMTGEIVDEAGKPLPGVVVQVVGSRLASARTAISDMGGRYVIPELPPGPYLITFARSGFSTCTREMNVVSTYVATINAQLHVVGVPGGAIDQRHRRAPASHTPE